MAVAAETRSSIAGALESTCAARARPLILPADMPCRAAPSRKIEGSFSMTLMASRCEPSVWTRIDFDSANVKRFDTAGLSRFCANMEVVCVEPMVIEPMVVREEKAHRLSPHGPQDSFLPDVDVPCETPKLVRLHARVDQPTGVPVGAGASEPSYIFVTVESLQIPPESCNRLGVGTPGVPTFGELKRCSRDAREAG